MKKYFLLLMLTPLNTLAQQTNYYFNHTTATTASPDAIWKVWTDVPNWKQWDDGLKDAYLDGKFEVGAKGSLIPDKGPKSKFIITEIEEGKSYTFKTRIPFGWLVIKRSLQTENNVTQFTHDVDFTGFLKKPLGNSIGKRYRTLLPEVMDKIKKLAESNS